MSLLKRLYSKQPEPDGKWADILHQVWVDQWGAVVAHDWLHTTLHMTPAEAEDAAMSLLAAADKARKIRNSDDPRLPLIG